MPPPPHPRDVWVSSFPLPRPRQGPPRERLVDRRRPRAYGVAALTPGRGYQGRPIAAEAAAVDGDAALVGFGRVDPGVEEARQHALGARRDLEGRLAGAGHV